MLFLFFKPINEARLENWKFGWAFNKMMLFVTEEAKIENHHTLFLEEKTSLNEFKSFSKFSSCVDFFHDFYSVY